MAFFDRRSIPPSLLPRLAKVAEAWWHTSNHLNSACLVFKEASGLFDYRGER